MCGSEPPSLCKYIRIILLSCSKFTCFKKTVGCKMQRERFMAAVSCHVHVCAALYHDQFVYLHVALAQRPDVAVQAAPHAPPTRQLPQKVCLPMAVNYLFLLTVQLLIGTPPALTHLGVLASAARELLVRPSENMPVFFHLRILRRIRATMKTVDAMAKVRANARTRLQAATGFNVVVKTTVAPATHCHLQRKRSGSTTEPSRTAKRHKAEAQARRSLNQCKDDADTRVLVASGKACQMPHVAQDEKRATRK